MTRTIFIGDLHGCLAEAEELLDACKASPSDHVVFLGDLVDRGPNSAGCIDLAMRIEARQGRPAAILGNHEEKHLDYEMLARKNVLDVKKMPPSHAKTRDELRPEHYDYLSRLPLFIRVPEHNIVAVHAGVYPGRSIENQTTRHLLHIQSINPPDERSLWPSRVPHGEEHIWRFWTQLWDGPERIVFGHSVLDRPLVTDKVVGIDGGACFGRELWAFIAPDNVVVKVQGRAALERHDNDRKRRARSLIVDHDALGEVKAFS